MKNICENKNWRTENHAPLTPSSSVKYVAFDSFVKYIKENNSEDKLHKTFIRRTPDF